MTIQDDAPFIAVVSVVATTSPGCSAGLETKFQPILPRDDDASKLADLGVGKKQLSDWRRLSDVQADFPRANPAALRPASRPKVAPDISPVPLA